MNKQCKRLKDMKRSNYFKIFCVALFLSLTAGCVEYPQYEIIDEFSIDKTLLNMYTGEKVQIQASPASGFFTWTIDNPSVAAVSSTGLVEAVGPGIAEIIVSRGEVRKPVPVYVTVPTADNVAFLGEGDKALVLVQTVTDRITAVRVYWNNNADSATIEVNNRIGIFSDSIDSSSKLFNYVSIDKFGNKSLVFEAGRTTLAHRTIAERYLDGETVTLIWSNDTRFMDYCILTYINNYGEKETRKALPSEMSTTIDNYLSDMYLQTVFLADFLTLDPIEVSMTAAPFNKSSWTVTTSGEDPNNPARVIIDGNYDIINNFWHSSGNPPHWIIVDMKRSRVVHRIDTHRRWVTGLEGDKGDTKTVEYYIGDAADANDTDAWTQIAKGEFPLEGNHILTLEASTLLSGQYLKINMPDSHRSPFCTLTEIDVYGY